MADPKLEFLKALQLHGQTLHKLASGGDALSGPTVTAQGTGPSHAGGILGGLNDLLGTQSNFSASGANLQAGTNASQLNNSYDNAQQGIGSQHNFLNALEAQNGIQNQTNSYNQMQGVVNGTGPNPAQTMLNNSTGQNVAAQAALMAGQRGAGANAGLIARQAAQQGASIQQNAAGQAAALQAQQSLNALNGASQIAQNQVNQQGQATQGYNTAVQNEQNILQGANTAFNNANVGMQSNINNTNAMISQGNQAAGNGLVGGIIKGVGGAIGGLFADGGEVKANVGEGHYNGQQSQSGPSVESTQKSGDTGGKALEGAFSFSLGDAKSGETGKSGGAGGGAPKASAIGFDEGGAVPKSHAAKILNGKDAPPQQPQPTQANNDTRGGLESLMGLDKGRGGLESMLGLSSGGPANMMNALKKGGKVPGNPKHPGVNTEENDTVPALLTPKEIVLPLTVTQSANPGEAAKRFVEALHKKQKMACGGTVQKMAEGGETIQLDSADPEKIADPEHPGYDFDFNKWKGEQSMKTDFMNGTDNLHKVGNAIRGAGRVLFDPRWVDKARKGTLTAPETETPAQASQAGENSGLASGEMPTNVDLGQPPQSLMPNENPQAALNAKYDPYQGYNTQIAGIKGEANAISGLEKEKANLMQEHEQQMQKLNYQAGQNAWNNQVETQNMIDDMKNGHIDPKAYINNMSGGQKVATAIGLILGGMGGGIDRTGQNPAMDFLNKQIDRDIASQVENRNNKQTIFNAMEKKYGNEKDAMNMTRAFYLSKLQNDLGTAAAKAGSPLAVARAQQAMGPIQTELQKLHLDVGMRQAAMNGLSSGGDPAPLVRYLVPAEKQQKVFEEIQTAQDTAKNAPKIMEAFDKAYNQHAVDYVPGMENAHQKAFHALLGPTFKDVEGTVRQAAMDNMYKNTTPAFGDSAQTKAIKRKAVQDYLDYKSSAPVAKGFGIDLQKFKTTKVGTGGFQKRK